MKNSRNSKATIQIVLGAIAAITLNAFIFTIIFLLFLNFTRSPTFLEKSMLNLASSIGLSQLIYIIPLAISLKQQRQKYWMQGVIIGACITALINGGCWAMNSF
jgi:predicted membrane-bound dolichyl-phosphate-mannose-protein mannosyltransferase